MKALYVLLWAIYTVLIMAILPLYLVSYPFDWVIQKIRKQKPTYWWWKLGDWLEDIMPPHDVEPATK